MEDVRIKSRPKKKYDNWATGIILGIITPIIILVIYYRVNYYYIRVDGFLFKMMVNKVMIPLLSLCVLGNLAIFYLFINKDYYYAARGVIFSTLLYAIIVFIAKLA
jgi:hypothetical protein